MSGAGVNATDGANTSTTATDAKPEKSVAPKQDCLTEDKTARRELSVWLLCLVLPMLVGVFIVFRPKYMITDAHIAQAALFVNKLHDAGVSVFEGAFVKAVQCQSIVDNAIVEPQNQSTRRSPTSFPNTGVIPWEDDSDIHSGTKDLPAWLRTHPYTTLQLHYMAQLYDTHSVNGVFAPQAYATILGYGHLHKLLPPKVVQGNNIAAEALRGAAAIIQTWSHIPDPTAADSVATEEMKGLRLFTDVMTGHAAQVARYSFSTARLRDRDMRSYCSGEDLHVALPGIFPCAPHDKLGGSFADHIGRTAAVLALAQHHAGGRQVTDLQHIGAWVCGGFSPATGTTTLSVLLGMYQYTASEEEVSGNRVRFQDFLKQAVAIKPKDE